MHRLFIAIDLPDQVKEAISAISLRDLGGARPVPRDQLHLTLRFVGEVDDRTFSEIRKSLARVKGAPFTLSIRGVGHFPPGRHPRVLWVGIEESSGLVSLQALIEQEVVAAGIGPEGRRFSPHITIARLKDASPAGLRHLEERHGGFSSGSFPVNEFYLYSSVLNREGAVHRREAVYGLAL